MEENKGWEQETLINELNQGRELTKQLKDRLDPMASPESCEFLIQKIISTYDKALSMLNLGDLAGEFHQVAGIEDPAQSLSEGSDHRDFQDQCNRDVYKKRKILPRRSEPVRICTGTGVATLDDGYNWRKYGQKDILGANFPRAYYRCTHRNVQGCLATKQVQRSDEDSSIFEITYRGRHTCIQTPAVAPNGKEFPIQKKDHYQPHLGKESQLQSQETLFNSTGTSLRLKSEDLGIMGGEIFPSFNFPSTPIESENFETNIFPETSESNFFQFFGLGDNLQPSDSDLSEIISAPTSVTNSPIGNLDFFSLDQVVDFDPNFDTSEFFS